MPTDMKTAQEKSHHKHLLVIGLILIVSLCLVSLKQREQIDLQITNTIAPSTSTFLGIVPTILPTSKDGWNTFTYPDENSKFSFEFPSTWDVKIKGVVDKRPTIVFMYKENLKNYKFSFNENIVGEYYGSKYSSKMS
jgi:hypothetical protein